MSTPSQRHIVTKLWANIQNFSEEMEQSLSQGLLHPESEELWRGVPTSAGLKSSAVVLLAADPFWPLVLASSSCTQHLSTWG